MKQAILIFVLAIVLLLSLSVAMISTAADNAIATYSDIQSRPPSAAELAMQSRQTPVVDDGRRSAFGYVLLLMVVLAGLFTVAVLSHGQGFLKQWRMTMKKQRPQQRQVAPQPDYLPPTILPPVNQIGRAQRPLELPQWTDAD